MNKDKDDLRKYQKGNIDRLNNLLKAEELRHFAKSAELAAKADELAAKDGEMTSMKDKIAELEVNCRPQFVEFQSLKTVCKDCRALLWE